MVLLVVRFRSMKGKKLATNVGPITYDKKLVIMKNWYADLDLMEEAIKVVPTWVRIH